MAPIHIAGAGSLGLLKAHYLTNANHKVVLILRNSASLKRFEDNKGVVKLTTLYTQKNGGPSAVKTLQSQVDGIVLEPPQTSDIIKNGRGEVKPVDLENDKEALASDSTGGAGFSPLVISKLVVATKAGEVSTVLERALPFMARGCQILLVQNGISAVYRRVHESFLSRPEISNLGIRLSLAVVTHGAYLDTSTPYHVIHSGMGSLFIQRVSPLFPTLEDPRQVASAVASSSAFVSSSSPSSSSPSSSSSSSSSRSPSAAATASSVADDGENESGESLTSAVVAALGLNARLAPSYRDFLEAAEAKLAGNAVINPMTALFNCRNADLLRAPTAARLFEDLSREVSTVLAATPPPPSLSPPSSSLVPSLIAPDGFNDQHGHSHYQEETTTTDNPPSPPPPTDNVTASPPISTGAENNGESKTLGAAGEWRDGKWRTLSEAQAAYAHRLFSGIYQVLEITAANRTSMLQDITARRRTEIDFLTGHVLALAKERGIDAPISRSLYDFVKAKEEIVALEDIYK